MLALARQKLAAYRPGLETEETSVNSSSIQGSSSAVAFVQHDFLASPDVPPTIPTPVSAMICTLVLEHFPLAPFFASFRNLLPVGGLALVTNMHSEMGLKGQAGFVSEQVDEQGRPVKIRGDSWPHTVEETVQAAEDAGFEIVALGGQGKIRERHVKEDMIEKLGDRAKKWVGVNVWYGFAVKRVQ
ncbi:hypothetical protein BDY21DRAFT_355580 [Lineolata rhizophorae]|uniref:Methyltransferase type 11 domain-containing protein n=1 Tax=Lineolata rhizophorae TaxID=578093 RepID=A0A6A6NPL7_9PEZI|nr:hypothetical protein BDY21DRAFT_355580 [Lineolata rhizophorae]